MNIYIDMVGDLFHYGHTNALKTIYDTYIKNTNNKLVVGVHNDKTVESYKRKPILTMDERIKVISTCKYIYKIIPDAPLEITEKYIKKNNINLICISGNRTNDEIELMYKNILHLNILKKIKYTDEISTSDIIKRIKDRVDL